jgi:hypothetical protein
MKSPQRPRAASLLLDWRAVAITNIREAGFKCFGRIELEICCFGVR